MNQQSLITKALSRLGIASLNAMQEAAASAYGKNGDLILLSPTGTGKTLAYLLPLLEGLDPSAGRLQALIITPTRELAMQIEQVFRTIGPGVKVNCCYGGRPMAAEKKSLQTEPTLLVGTPGRILDHLDQKTIDVSAVRTWVLDEFDKSLEMGFQEEMAAIIGQLPNVSKRILTSATNSEIPGFTGLKNTQVLDFLGGKSAVDRRIALYRVESDQKDKLDTLFGLLTGIEPGLTLVFCNQRDSVDRVYDFLQSEEISCERFHGGMEQPDRERALSRFRNGSSPILVSTDLAARGLDIAGIRYVIHYHLPLDEEAFTHRNGRTARVQESGTVFLIIGPGEKCPAFVPASTKPFTPEKAGTYRPEPDKATLYIGVGKKDKINKVDIVGFLLQKGGLDKQDVGLIEIKEYHAYVAIDRDKVAGLLPRIRNEKIKNKKTKFEISGD